MSVRTDLVCERREMHTENLSGATYQKKLYGNTQTEIIDIDTPDAAKSLKKPVGRYISVSFPSLQNLMSTDEIKSALKDALELISPKKRDNVMVVGLGNADITPDALGPFTADKIFATRHLDGGLIKDLGLDGLKCVSAVKTGVLGKTGIESADAVLSYCKIVSPDFLIIIDALAARKTYRLCRTVQLSDTGIVAGSGVGNARKEISRDTIGIPVVSIGIPTVIDAETYKYDCDGKSETESLFVTPKDIDRLIEISSSLLSEGINEFLQPDIDADTIKSLM